MPSNGYSPVCPSEPTGKWILGLSALSERSLDVSQAKFAPMNDELVDRYQLQPGDFLISRSNAIEKVGRVGVYRGGLDNCSYSDLMMRFRPDESKVYPDYLEAYLRGDAAVKFIQRHATGTSGSMKKINQAVVEAIPIVLPSLDAQMKIAAIHTAWESCVDKTNRLIEAKLKVKQAIMKQLLVKEEQPRDSKVSGHPYHLGELFSERCETGYQNLPLLSITGEAGIIFRDGGNRKDSSSEDKSNYLRICPGDIGYNTMRMWQGVSALSSLEGIVSPAYTVCIPKNGVDGQFMAYLFKLPTVINLFYRFSQGLTSDTWNLKFHHFAKIKVTIPDIEEQKAIVKALAVCDEEIRLLKNNLEAIKKQKRGLMQKLLRVKAAGEVS
jgi:type I restriction enzyme S subunit